MAGFRELMELQHEIGFNSNVYILPLTIEDRLWESLILMA